MSRVSVQRVGMEEFKVLCSVCGRVAMRFKKGVFYGKEGLVYTGITHETAIPLGVKDKVFGFLNDKDLAGLHEFVKDFVHMEDGLDAYCPECGEVYCGEHVRTEIEWDDGFYDCTYGICPEGHRRIIDD